MAEKIVVHVVKKNTENGAQICIEYLKEEESQVCYLLPNNLQPVKLHTDLMSSKTITNAINSLIKVGQFRNIKIRMTPEVMENYRDKDGNYSFMDFILEEVKFKEEENRMRIKSEEQEDTTATNIRQLEQSFALEKFDKSRLKAEDWIDDYERECSRLKISSEETKIRGLKIFMQGPTEDWYKATSTQLSFDDFGQWKRSFLKVFDEPGWLKITFALGFKYIGGSFAEYAMKKLRLLLEVERGMTVETRIMLIVFGLPAETHRFLDRTKIQDVETLMNELNKLESPSRQFQKETKEKNWESAGEKKPCSKCEAMNMPNRFHPIEKCWNRGKSNTKSAKINFNQDSNRDWNENKQFIATSSIQKN